MTLDEQNQLLIAFGERDDLAAKTIYTYAFPYCASYVLKNSGNLSQAKELFQDVLIALFKKIKQNSHLEIKQDLKYYLYGFTKNLWLKRLRGKKGDLVMTLDDPKSHQAHLLTEEDSEIEEKQIKEQRIQLLLKGMNQLKTDCKTLLRFTFYEKKPDKEIAPLMEYSLAFVKQKRRRCIQKLKNIILVYIFLSPFIQV